MNRTDAEEGPLRIARALPPEEIDEGDQAEAGDVSVLDPVKICVR